MTQLELINNCYDDYLDEYILKSQFYSIFLNENHIGYFTVIDENILTQFFVPPSLLMYSQDIFSKVIEDFNIRMMIVASFDESNMVRCLDEHTRIEMHSYYFKKNIIPVRKPEFEKKHLKPATKNDLDDIGRYTEEFIDNHEKRVIKNQLYTLRDSKGEFIGLGVLIKHTLNSKTCSIGAFCREEYRNKGAGRSIIIHLNEICEENGLIARPACWYYNIICKKMLESAGFVADSRVIKFFFKDDDEK